MDARRASPGAGQKLRALRVRLGLSTRDVQRKSEQIATEKKNQEYYLSHGWLTDIEKGKFTPSIFKLYSLSAIYHRGFTEIASYFGLQIGDLRRDSAGIGLPKTHLLENESRGDSDNISVPVEFKPDFRFEQTNLLSRVVEKWDEVPVGLLHHLDLRKSTYGYIGLEDFTLYPLIRPGSLVQIDSSERKISAENWKTEFERPIYFTELRNGYVCSWCQVDRGQLIVIPHPQSRQEVRRFDYPSQAEIVGRVTGVAMRIVVEAAAERRHPGRER
jgi:transcriptional regulator with XRE-family HTH domain